MGYLMLISGILVTIMIDALYFDPNPFRNKPINKMYREDYYFLLFLRIYLPISAHFKVRDANLWVVFIVLVLKDIQRLIVVHPIHEKI